jgi:hypothetical protein
VRPPTVRRPRRFGGILTRRPGLAVLIDLGVREVWAKAITAPHGRILERIGAGHVVYPERDTGKRVAHLISGKLMDYIEFDDGFAIVRCGRRGRGTGGRWPRPPSGAGTA